jgi:ketosteroid isomerase-like protein
MVPSLAQSAATPTGTGVAAGDPVGSDAAGTAAVEAVTAAFVRYERALVDGDVAVMTELFAAGSDTVRFGITDYQVGSEELAAWRHAQPPLPAGRRLYNTRFQPAGPDTVIVTTMFDYPGDPLVGRQSQVWSRQPDGWRIVHAHVSQIPG